MSNENSIYKIFRLPEIAGWFYYSLADNINIRRYTCCTISGTYCLCATILSTSDNKHEDKQHKPKLVVSHLGHMCCIWILNQNE
uniref:Ovule protein n=1 Tax=Heterorhabditis bacteriophora TaxID=37862 RepID=A0A1I7WPR2_HETBA